MVRTFRTIALAVLVAAAFLAGAADEKQEGAAAGEQTIVGELVDTHCYLSKGKTGEEHAGCANACLSRDVPAGLVTSDGTLYLLLNDRPTSLKEKVAGKAGKQVTAHGKVVERGTMKAIQVTSIE